MEHHAEETSAEVAHHRAEDPQVSPKATGTVGSTCDGLTPVADSTARSFPAILGAPAATCDGLTPVAAPDTEGSPFPQSYKSPAAGESSPHDFLQESQEASESPEDAELILREIAELAELAGCRIDEPISIERERELLDEANVEMEAAEQAPAHDDVTPMEVTEDAPARTRAVAPLQGATVTMSDAGVLFPVHADKHPFDDFYSHVSTDRFPKKPLQKRLAAMNLERVQQVRNSTIEAITAPANVISPPEQNGKPLSVFLSADASHRESFFVVVVRTTGSEVVVTPVFREYMAGDRGDLMYLIADCNTRLTGNPGPLRPMDLLVGDTLAVKSVVRRRGRTAGSWSNAVPSQDRVNEAFFAVSECSVLDRLLTTNAAAEKLAGARRGKHYPFVVNGLSELAFASKAVQKTAKEGPYAVDVFQPQTTPGQLLRVVRRGEPRREVLSRTKHLCTKWTVNPVIVSFKPRSPTDAKHFSITPKVFKAGVDEKTAFKAISRHSRFAVLAMLAINDLLHDRRFFVGIVRDFTKPSDRSALLRIEVPQGTGADTSARRWPKGTAFAIEVNNHLTAQCTVREAFCDSKILVLHARVMTPGFVTEVGQRVAVVQNPQELGELAWAAPFNTSTPKITPHHHALVAMRAALGGPPLPPLPELPSSTPRQAISTLCLSEEQAKVTQVIASDGFSAISISCAFGTGKTTTAIIGVIRRILERKTPTQAMFVGVTNAAAMAAISAARRLDVIKTLRPVRLISEPNRVKLEEEHTSEDDFPLKWRQVFRERITELNNSKGCISDDDMEMALYLRNHNELKPTDVSFPALHQVVFRQNRRPKSSLMNLFCRVYKPNLIVSTIASAKTLLADQDLEDYRDMVDLAVVDEASQLPIFALLSLTMLVPKARIVLLGDVHQLPPHTPAELPQVLSNAAIGSILKESMNTHFYPSLPLSTVYRCPTEITRALSTAFYNSALKPHADKKPSEAVFGALDIFTRFPLVWLHHQFEQTQDGPSVENEEEVAMALSCAERLQGANPTASIAAIAFYKASATMMAFRAPPSLSVLTVDSVQGREYDYVIILTSRTTGPSAFLANAERINVAVSRAVKGCLILGSRSLLSTTAPWRALMDQMPKEAFITPDEAEPRLVNLTSRRLAPLVPLASPAAHSSSAPPQRPLPHFHPPSTPLLSHRGRQPTTAEVTAVPAKARSSPAKPATTDVIKPRPSTADTPIRQSRVYKPEERRHLAGPRSFSEDSD